MTGIERTLAYTGRLSFCNGLPGLSSNDGALLPSLSPLKLHGQRTNNSTATTTFPNDTGGSHQNHCDVSMPCSDETGSL
jgi:hypothetical protein